MNRYLTLQIPDGAANAIAGSSENALRVTQVSLMRPDPPNLPLFPAPDFSVYEEQVRWIGPVGDCPETEAPLTTFKCATLQCAPYYTDWASALGGQVLHVTGAEVVPSSAYDVQQVPESCQGNEVSCLAISAPLRVNTFRWGDVVDPFQDPSPAALTQPNIQDVAAVVDKFTGVASAPIKARCQMRPNVPDPNSAINIVDVAHAVDAFQNFAYPYSGPTACP
jgi:hypothetical protein